MHYKQAGRKIVAVFTEEERLSFKRPARVRLKKATKATVDRLRTPVILTSEVPAGLTGRQKRKWKKRLQAVKWEEMIEKQYAV